MKPGQTRLITFAQTKGGVGKSTMLLCVAGAIASKGYPVRIIDLDQNGSLIRWASKHGHAYPLISVETVDDAALGPYLLERFSKRWQEPEFILLDLAGALSKTAYLCAGLSHLTISPTKLSEMDLSEATKLHFRIRAIADERGRDIVHRVLLNEVITVGGKAQHHSYAQLAKIPMKRFTTEISQRSAYRDQFFGEPPPHFSDVTREPVRKARDEIESLVQEIFALVGFDEAENQNQEESAAA